jgi:hypothetical protein
MSANGDGLVGCRRGCERARPDQVHGPVQQALAASIRVRQRCGKASADSAPVLPAAASLKLDDPWAARRVDVIT